MNLTFEEYRKALDNNLTEYQRIADSLPTHMDRLSFTSKFLGALSCNVKAEVWNDVLQRTLKHEGSGSGEAA